MDEVYSWVKNIVIYMILNTIIMNMLGNKSYKKYVSIVSGMILVLIVISPIIRLMKLEDKLEFFIQANDYSLEAAEFKNDLSRVEQEQKDLILEEYEEKIRQETEKLLQEEGLTLTGFDIEIDQDVNSIRFGEITRINITATAGQQEEKNRKRLNIREIEVAAIKIGDRVEDEEENVPSPLEIKMKNKLSDFYNVEQGNINISIQGG